MSQTAGKIIPFEDRRGGLEYDEYVPAAPSREEAEMLEAASDEYKRTRDEEIPPSSLRSGKDLKMFWERIIIPIAESENTDPWNIAAVFYAKSHGLRFKYRNGKPCELEYPENYI